MYNRELIILCFTVSILDLSLLSGVDSISLLSAKTSRRHLTRERVVNNSDNLKNDKYLKFKLQIYPIYKHTHKHAPRTNTCAKSLSIELSELDVRKT